jgi:3-isopropylmalate/(R)-2-methylmalate dehydratase small subunit
MKPFTRLDARAAPLDIANIDTDQIIPARYLKTVERTGLGKGLFAAMRYEADGAPRPDFVLNRPEYQGAGILIAGDNFGCGSSREHAPWALEDFGIRCVIATSFADIFYNNCFNNGLLPIVLPGDEVRSLMDEAKGGNHVFSVDLEARTVTLPSGRIVDFKLDAGRQEKLVKGLDAIGETLQHVSSIDAFEQNRLKTQPWVVA